MTGQFREHVSISKHAKYPNLFQENANLPEAIERETFYMFKRLINHNYRRTMRTLVFTLKNNEEIKKKVISGDLKVNEFVQTYKK